jgi:long-chain acyl-CoA synthetase
MFPSVPRLWNRIYAKINENVKGLTGCKGWLVNTALNAKLENASRNGAFTHGCYDFLVFKKMKAMLGGNVRIMLTASAPIDK